MAIMAFRSAWVDAVKPVKATIRNMFRDEVAAYLTAAELAGKDTGGTRLILVGGVPYAYDSTDTTSADNGVTVLVSNDGGRYKPVTGFRNRLTGNRTYYVRADGSDSNSGLANTSGGAYLTIQKAIDEVAQLDIGTNTVTIQVDSGTYAGFSVNSQWLGSGTVNLVGNTGNPALVTIAGGGGTAVTVNGGRLNVSGFNFTAGGFGLYAAGGGTLTMNGLCHFGLCSGAHAYADDSGKVALNAAYVINALGGVHIGASGGGRLQCNNRGAITMASGLNAASSFCSASRLGIVECYGTTFGASATGIRYLVDSNAVIYTLGAGASLFPGSIGGVAQTGGQYL